MCRVQRPVCIKTEEWEFYLIPRYKIEISSINECSYKWLTLFSNNNHTLPRCLYGPGKFLKTERLWVWTILTEQSLSMLDRASISPVELNLMKIIYNNWLIWLLCRFYLKWSIWVVRFITALSGFGWVEDVNLKHINYWHLNTCVFELIKIPTLTGSRCWPRLSWSRWPGGGRTHLARCPQHNPRPGTCADSRETWGN